MHSTEEKIRKAIELTDEIRGIAVGSSVGRKPIKHHDALKMEQDVYVEFKRFIKRKGLLKCLQDLYF